MFDNLGEKRPDVAKKLAERGGSGSGALAARENRLFGGSDPISS
jgi:hypothetical protein